MPIINSNQSMQPEPLPDETAHLPAFSHYIHTLSQGPFHSAGIVYVYSQQETAFSHTY